MIEHKSEIGSLTRMIRAPRLIYLATARPKNHHRCTPSSAPGFDEEPLDIMRPHATFESVQKHKERRSVSCIEVVEVDEIAVRSLQPLDSCIVYLWTTEKFSP